MPETVKVQLYYGFGEYMVHKDLTCQISVQLRKMLKNSRKNLGGYNQLVGQSICSRFRALILVSDGTNQQK
jgi:hypothetical protein